MENSSERNNDEVYSKAVRAGKRTYFFDIKATKGNDLYITITESKRRTEDGSGYEKHKIFLYKEDFIKFKEGLLEVIEKIDVLNANDSQVSSDFNFDDL